jgi:hypothetical protein
MLRDRIYDTVNATIRARLKRLRLQVLPGHHVRFFGRSLLFRTMSMWYSVVPLTRWSRLFKRPWLLPSVSSSLSTSSIVSG